MDEAAAHVTLTSDPTTKDNYGEPKIIFSVQTPRRKPTDNQHFDCTTFIWKPKLFWAKAFHLLLIVMSRV